MIKRTTKVSLRIPPVRLYLDDLEEIEKLLKDGGFSVEYDAPDSTCDSLAELVEAHARNKQLHELVIWSKRPIEQFQTERVTVNMNRLCWRIDGDNDSPEIVGLCHKVKAIVRTRLFIWYRLCRISDSIRELFDLYVGTPVFPDIPRFVRTGRRNSLRLFSMFSLKKLLQVSHSLTSKSASLPMNSGNACASFLNFTSGWFFPQ